MKWFKKFMVDKFTAATLLMVILDVIFVNASTAFALLLRFDMRYSSIPQEYIKEWMSYIPIRIVVTVLVYSLFRLYKSLWRYASINELLTVFAATLVNCVLNIFLSLVIFCRMPIAYYVVGWLFIFCTTAFVRFSYRLARLIAMSRNRRTENCRTMIIGAGEAGRAIIREIMTNESLCYNVCCVIDDDKKKIGRVIDNVPVVGGIDDIFASVEKYKIEKIIFAIPSASAQRRRDILHICSETSCEIKAVPGIYQLVNGTVSVAQLKKVSVEELLGRDPIKVNLQEIMGYVSGKTILVTGGGGSIGSELCRQIALHAPKQLIIFDIYENNAYDIQQELKRTYPALDLVTLIGSVRDVKRIEWVFEKYRPDIVYHAAAHKHVPLMEDSPNESIKNNVFGTFNTSNAADKYGAKKFVLISTDKAVNPTNIMGASKRICEMVVQAFNRKSKTEFVAVRFGNVLGSNGSVIPLFRRQIAEGGPVTVTHPDIIRYFMTIPEAVSLVLQAGAYAKGGEIFIFDMGEPVKIDSLARNLIRLSGYTPDVDIKVEYVGLRPGEKLYEELLLAEEGMADTANKLIHIGKPIEMNDKLFKAQLDELYTACNDNSENIRELVAKIVTTYVSDRDRNQAAADENNAAEAEVKSEGQKAGAAALNPKRCTA